VSSSAKATAGLRPGGFVTIAPEWKGETAFLICGGMSFAGVDAEMLRGRRVIVVNSSVYTVPWADVLFYGDERWELENRSAVKAFAGRVISSTYGNQHCNYVQFLSRPRPADTPPGLSANPSEAWMHHTSARGAINVLCHLGVSKIVTAGLDGGPDADGKTHHHRPHCWGMNPQIWNLQRAELEAVQPDLAKRGVTLINASPGSRIPFWPIMSLSEALEVG
jgi:hypothetical protein